MKYNREQKCILLVSLLSSFITTFMGSALNLSIPDIEKEFQVSAAQVGWIVTIYMLTCAALAVPFGKLADMISIKKIIRIGLLLFTVSSAAVFIAAKLWMLMLIRFCQAVGASMIFSTNISILVSAFEEKQRGKILGYSTSATYIGMSAGPLLGGVLNYFFDWKAVFLLSSCIGAVAFFVGLKRIPVKGKALQDKKQLSVKEIVIYVGSIVVTMYGFSSLFRTKAAILLLGLGIGLLILFIRTELNAENPMIDVKFFKDNIPYLCANTAALISYGVNYAVSYLISIYLQVVKGYSSLWAGIILIVSPLVMALLSPWAGRLSDRIRPEKLSAAGMLLCAVSVSILIFISEKWQLREIILALLVLGLGFSFFAAPNSRTVMSFADKETYGALSSILATMRSIGHTLSMSLITIVCVVYLGDISISQARPEIIIKTMRTCFILFDVCCTLGIFMAQRKKV